MSLLKVDFFNPISQLKNVIDVNKGKDEPQVKGNICLTHLIKDLYVECIKNSDNSIKRPTNQLKGGPKKWKRYFTKEGKQIANQCMKMCSTPLNIRDMQIKIEMRSHYIPIRIAKIKKKDHIKCW